jgi:hypothetical protein
MDQTAPDLVAVVFLVTFVVSLLLTYGGGIGG